MDNREGEIAFEFGLHAEADVGIASGLIAIMAGIYFQLQHGGGPPPQTACVLTGYFRMRGHVSLLGLVAITLEVYLGLTYQSVGNKVIGQATVMLDIQVLFFTMSVSFNVERQFSGDSPATGALRQGPRGSVGQPLSADDHGLSFLDQIPSQEIWNDYADAFAPVGG